MSNLPKVDRNNVYRDGEAVEQIPVDKAYICKAISCKITENSYGSKVEIAFDIDEGDYKGYYKKRFEADKSEDAKWKGVIRIDIPDPDKKNQPEWVATNYNTNIANLEDSNPGYVFDADAKKIAGRRFGMVFRNKEWEQNGNRGFWSEPYRIITLEDAKNQKFRPPKDKLLSNSSNGGGTVTANDGFMNIPEGAEEELPF